LDWFKKPYLDSNPFGMSFPFKKILWLIFLPMALMAQESTFFFSSPTWEQIATPTYQFDKLIPTPKKFIGIENDQLYFGNSNSSWLDKQEVGDYWVTNNSIVTTRANQTYSQGGSSPVQHTLLYQEINFDGELINSYQIQPNNAFLAYDWPLIFYNGNGLVAFKYTWNFSDRVSLFANGSNEQLSHQEFDDLPTSHGSYLGKSYAQHIWRKNDSLQIYNSLASDLFFSIVQPFDGEWIVLDDKIFIYNNEMQRVATFDSGNQVWAEKEFPTEEPGELIVNGGKFYFRGLQSTYNISPFTFDLFEVVGENDLLDNALA